MRLFHSATTFCCYICTCICCLKLHQVGEGFFNSIWWGPLSSNVLTIYAVYWSLGRRGYFGVSNVGLVYSFRARHPVWLDKFWSLMHGWHHSSTHQDAKKNEKISSQRASKVKKIHSMMPSWSWMLSADNHFLNQCATIRPEPDQCSKKLTGSRPIVALVEVNI